MAWMLRKSPFHEYAFPKISSGKFCVCSVVYNPNLKAISADSRGDMDNELIH